MNGCTKILLGNILFYVTMKRKYHKEKSVLLEKSVNGYKKEKRYGYNIKM